MKSLRLLALAFLVTTDLPAADRLPAGAFASVKNTARLPASPFAGPHAVFNGSHIVTAHQDSRGRPVVMAYDTEAESWSGPVRASGHVLDKAPGGNPAVCIDRHEIVHLFFGGHRSRIQHVRALRAIGIERWKIASPPVARGSWPQAFCMADGSIRLFFRNDADAGSWAVVTSKDDGDTWSEARTLFKQNESSNLMCLFQAGPKNTTIHAIILEPEKAGRERFASAKYLLWDQDDRWRTGTGKEVTPPLDQKSMPASFTASVSGTPIGLPRMVVDENDQVYFRTPAGNGLHFARYADKTLTAGDKWPEEWPEVVRRIASAPGTPVGGALAPALWYTVSDRQVAKDPSRAFIWLGHVDDGFQPGPDGPVDEPADEEGGDGPTALLN